MERSPVRESVLFLGKRFWYWTGRTDNATVKAESFAFALNGERGIREGSGVFGIGGGIHKTGVPSLIGGAGKGDEAGGREVGHPADDADHFRSILEKKRIDPGRFEEIEADGNREKAEGHGE